MSNEMTKAQKAAYKAQIKKEILTLVAQTGKPFNDCASAMQAAASQTGKMGEQFIPIIGELKLEFAELN